MHESLASPRRAVNKTTLQPSETQIFKVCCVKTSQSTFHPLLQNQPLKVKRFAVFASSLGCCDSQWIISWKIDVPPLLIVQ